MRYLAAVFALAAVLAASWDGACTSTFSVAAVDTATGEAGVAVASKVLSVGYIVPWADPDAGAVATQALANAGFGPLGLELLEEGMDAGEVMDSLRAADPDIVQRQLGIVDMEGGSATFTGEQTLEWSGGAAGSGYAIQGNILTGPEVVDEMEAAFLETEGPLSERMLQALLAGDRAGGDSRGRQSAAMLVVRPEGGYQGSSDRLVDIRVADHPDPVAELERIYRLWEPTFVMPVYLQAGGEPEMGRALAMLEGYMEAGEDSTRKAAMLNSFAWTIVTGDLDGYDSLALELAEQAHALAPDNANIMDTLATCHFAVGNVEEAVEWEQRALEMDPGNAFFIEQLERFRTAGTEEDPYD
jgi:uncharacterized Ntn-hydrolase superfamily protein